MIAAPPLLVDQLNEMIACQLLATAVTFVGAFGTLGVMILSSKVTSQLYKGSPVPSTDGEILESLSRMLPPTKSHELAFAQ